MEITWATRINMAAMLVGLVTILSEYVQVHGQRSRTFAEGALRLVGGRTKHEGTVLIYHWSRWGSICDDYWDIRDANVVCRELGYPGALEAPRRSRYGKGRRRVWLSGLHCRGNEEYVTMCVSRGWGQYLRRCSSYWSSAGVVCRPNPERATNGTAQRHRNHRNRVRAMVPRPATMSTKPTPTTSTTTTTTTTTTTPTTTTSTTTTTTTPIPTTTKMMATSESSDTKETLAMLGLDLEAKELPSSENSIDLQSDASFVQQLGSNIEPAFTGAPAPAPAQTSQSLPEEDVAASPGRKPEVDPGIAMETATDKAPMSTRPMTTEATTVPTTSKLTTTTTKRPTTTTKRPTTTSTTKRPTTVTTTTKKPATTTKPVPRQYNRWVYDRDTWRYYMYFRDGRVITSRPDPRYYRYTSTTETPATTSTTTRRPTTRPTTRATTPPRSQTYNLRGISNAVESDPNNVIDVIAPSEIRQRPSNTLQRHEGRHSHRHHSEGKAGYVGDQPVDVVTANEVPAKPATSAPEPDAPNYTEYRVVGGREYENYKEGRIELRLAGSNVWGVLCGDLWDMRGAIVACRHLGTGYARMAQTTDFYGGSDMLKVASAIRCTGREERLEDCVLEKYERTPGKETCSKPKSVAGIICETRLPDLEPDISALQSSVYLQDRYAYYLQCAFEEGCLSSSATALKDTPRWDYATRRLLRFSTVAINNGKADFRPNIDRSQWEWHACHMHFHSMEAFSHYDMVDSNGNKIAEGHKASFCLEDTHCNRGVYPKYDCQQNGNQGISVGCRDSYLHDIDCQWIDVTDVKPGTYTLKVEINPHMLVPEISFDNNVAICTLQITRTTARAWGCKMGSLL